MTREHFIKKEDTNYIKGIALILMFFHHFFTYPEWRKDVISYSLDPLFAFFSGSFKICVPVFAFLTGYFYYFSKRKNFAYSFKKGTDLWINYAFTFLIMLIPIALFTDYSFEPLYFLAELFTYRQPIMMFCWYVLFYLCSMLVLPLYARISKKSPVLAFGIAVILPSFFSLIASRLSFPGMDVVYHFVNIMPWFICTASGYLFAQLDLFRSISDAVRFKNRFLQIIVFLLFMIVPFLTRCISVSIDFISAPLFIFGFVSLIHRIPWKKLLFPLSLIGKYSLSMWFIHCIFFNQLSVYTQKILYFPKSPTLVLIWGLTISLILSVLIMLPIRFLTNFKNKLLKL